MIEDEDRNPVYKIEFIFPELPNTRMIKLTRIGNNLRVRMNETPNQRIADSIVNTVTQGGSIGFAMGIIEKRAGEDFIERKLHSVFNPELMGIDTRTEGWESIIAAENQAIAERHAKSGKLVKSMVNRFIGGDKDSSQKKQKEKEKEKSPGFLHRAIGVIKMMKKKKSSGDIKVKEFTELEVGNELAALPAPEETPSTEPSEVAADTNAEFVTVLDKDGEVCIVPAEQEVNDSMPSEDESGTDKKETDEEHEADCV